MKQIAAMIWPLIRAEVFWAFKVYILAAILAFAFIYAAALFDYQIVTVQ